MGSPALRRQRCFVGCAKCLRICSFWCIFTGSLLTVGSPWLCTVLELSELLSLSLLLNEPFWHILSPQNNFSFSGSVEDVVLLGILRALLLGSVYVAFAPFWPIPYWYKRCAYLVAVLTIPYGLAKVWHFRFSPHAQSKALETVILGGCIAWPVVHVFVSEHVVREALKRHNLGISLWPPRPPPLSRVSPCPTPASPAYATAALLSPSEALLRGARGNVRFSDVLVEGGSEQSYEGGGARPDGRFLQLGAVRLFYEEVRPDDLFDEHKVVVLVHGFGGCTLCWRHIAEGLAARCGCRVVVFDRPAFGRTEVDFAAGRSPPAAFTTDDQGRLLAELAAAVRACELVVAGHGDGAAVALLAACRLAAVAAAAADADGAPRRPATPPDGASPARPPPGGAASLLHASRSTPGDFLLVAPDAADARRSASAPPVPAPPPAAPSSVQSSPRSAGAPPPTTHVPNGAGEGAQPCNANAVAPRPLHVVVAPLHPTAHAEPDPRHPCATQPSQKGTPAVAGAEPSPSASAAKDFVVADGPAAAGVRLRGLALLHPRLEGDGASAGVAGQLCSSKLGRHILRSLLKPEVGEVFNRRAWRDPARATRGVLELYARPQRARGWDRALVEACGARSVDAATAAAKWRRVRRACGADAAVMVLTGLQDALVTPAAGGCLAYQLGCELVLLPECGHLSYEEAAPELLDALVRFVRGAFS